VGEDGEASLPLVSAAKYNHSNAKPSGIKLTKAYLAWVRDALSPKHLVKVVVNNNQLGISILVTSIAGQAVGTLRSGVGQ